MFVVGLVLFGVAMAAYGLLFAVWLGQRWAPKNAEPAFGEHRSPETWAEAMRAHPIVGNEIRDNIVVSASSVEKIVDGR